MENITAPTLWKSLRWAILGKCPACGKAKLFRAYLKQVENCAACHEKFGHIRADDGPAWLSIIVVGHFTIPLVLVVEEQVVWSTPLSIAVWCSVLVAATLLCLPRAKGAFIALIWRTKCAGSEDIEHVR